MAQITKTEVIELLKQKQGDRPATQLAAELEVSSTYLGDVLAGRREPGPAILKGLGLEAETIYVPASE